MNDRERALLRGLISEANNALMEGDDDGAIVAMFLENVTVPAATVLYREVLRRRGSAEESA